ncbi:hypothetical protein diail_1925 [Diaporthe ilicicola]|nr:hypothetical protein diail_1925 [Diaporthe ilicicola]
MAGDTMPTNTMATDNLTEDSINCADIVPANTPSEDANEGASAVGIPNEDTPHDNVAGNVTSGAVDIGQPSLNDNAHENANLPPGNVVTDDSENEFDLLSKLQLRLLDQHYKLFIISQESITEQQKLMDMGRQLQDLRLQLVDKLPSPVTCMVKMAAEDEPHETQALPDAPENDYSQLFTEYLQLLDGYHQLRRQYLQSEDEYPKLQLENHRLFKAFNQLKAQIMENARPKEMHLFMQLPAELRIMIWEIAIEDAELPKRPIKRFRLNLIYDPIFTCKKYPLDKGWVACFSPLKSARVECNSEFNTGARSHHMFLAASSETRKIMMRSMVMLTLNELPVDSHGNYTAPRKISIPFNVKQGWFCIEGINAGLRQSDDTKKAPAFSSPPIPLTRILSRARGLEFAPQIKHLALVPDHLDLAAASRRLRTLGHAFNLPNRPVFLGTVAGSHFVAVAKQFIHMETVTSALPLRFSENQTFEANVFLARAWLCCKSFNLRGKRKGGLPKMSDADKKELFTKVWRRIFDDHFLRYERMNS